jgi:hypothetical protein
MEPSYQFLKTQAAEQKWNKATNPQTQARGISLRANSRQISVAQSSFA